MNVALTDLERYMNEGDDYDPLIRIALIHYQFETIHPFLDGNGRVGRLMILLYLMEQGYISKPNHVLLKPREQEKPVLILDVDFLRTLDAVEAGYPIGLLAPQYEQTVTRFLRQLDDYNLTEDNDDGEIIIANRKKSYKKSIYVIDNKYNFEEED